MILIVIATFLHHHFLILFVTENFSCPFCLVHCASFKGLRLHLSSSHDLFNFEFWVTKEYQAVNVSIKSEIWRSEGNIADVDDSDPRFKPFFLCSRSGLLKRRHKVVQDAIYFHPQTEKSDSPESPRVGLFQTDLKKNTTISTPENFVGPLSNGVIASEEPFTARIVSTQSLCRIVSDIQDTSEEEQAGQLVQALSAEKAKPLLNDIAQDDDKEGTEEMGMLDNAEVGFLSEQYQMESSMVEQVCPGDGLGTGTHGSGSASGCLAMAVTSGTSECDPRLSSINLLPPSRLHFGKTRRLSVEQAELQNCALLQKRQFFHSHTAQPMALEQVFSDRDSEDEVDDYIADFEDRRMLDDFVDVAKHEKQVMHLWNSFVRKQRLLADGHIPWACEAFSQLHGDDFCRVWVLQWCWRLFMIKLWNHGLLDAGTMNRCNIILDSFSKNQ